MENFKRDVDDLARDLSLIRPALDEDKGGAEAQAALVVALNKFRGALHQRVAHLPEEEQVPRRTYCLSRLGSLLEKSPFIARALHKPLGYAGDYVLMDMLYRPEEYEAATPFGRALDHYFKHEPAAIANVNRVGWLVDKIIGELRREEERITRRNVLSLGCGPAREIELLLKEHPWWGPLLRAQMVDSELAAAKLAQLRVGPLAAYCNAEAYVHHTNAVRFLLSTHARDRLGLQDVIYSAGMFDYFKDALFGRLLESLYKLLAPGGLLIVGNVAEHNPSRQVMEYFTEWFLHHRSADQLRAMAGKALPESAAISVESEPDGVNLFLCARKKR